MTVILHAEADAEFAAAVRYYADVSPEVGHRFWDAVTGQLRAAGGSPRLNRMIRPPFRRALVRGFPYAVLYAERAGHVLVVAIMHLSRSPGYWLDRIAER